MLLEPSVRSLFLEPRETAVPSDVGSKDGCEPSVNHFCGQACPPGVGPGQLTPPLAIEVGGNFASRPSPGNVRKRSKADVVWRQRHFRFTPGSKHSPSWLQGPLKSSNRH